MITSQKDKQIVSDLIAALEQNMRDCGDCDHSVGICICHLIRLRESAQKLIDENTLPIATI